MHELTGDFFTVSQILGHSLKGTGIQLNLSSSLDSVTAQYVDVRLKRKLVVLDTYHQAVLRDKKNGSENGVWCKAPNTIFGAAAASQRCVSPYFYAPLYRLICGAGHHFGTTTYKMTYIQAGIANIVKLILRSNKHKKA